MQHFGYVLNLPLKFIMLKKMFLILLRSLNTTSHRFKGLKQVFDIYVVASPGVAVVLFQVLSDLLKLFVELMGGALKG